MDKENQFDLLQAMMKQIKIEDPSIRELIERFNESRKKSTQTEITKEIIRGLRIQNRKLQGQVATLKEKRKSSSADGKQIEHKINHLKNLTTELAKTLEDMQFLLGGMS